MGVYPQAITLIGPLGGVRIANVENKAAPLTPVRNQHTSLSAVWEAPVVMFLSLGDFDWGNALKAAGLIGAAIAWIYQVRSTLVRGKIKTDLEILEKAKSLFGPTDERTKNVESKVSRLMKYQYRGAGERGRFSLPDLALGVVCLSGGVAFAVWGGWWPVARLSIAGLLVFIAFGAFLNAVQPERPSPRA